MPHFFGILFATAGYGAYKSGYFDHLLLRKLQHTADSPDVATFNKDSTADTQLVEKTDELKGPEPVLEERPEPVFEKGPEPILEKLPELVREELPESVLEKLPEPVLEKLPEEVFNRGAEPVPENNSNLLEEESLSSSQTEISNKDNAVKRGYEKGPNFSEVLHGNDESQPTSLLNAYLIKDSPVDSTSDTLSAHKDVVEEMESADKDVVEEMESEGLAYVADDGKLILDFIQAIHTAEKRQAELDARVHFEEKRMIKEKYEKNLNDARARELMYAEREAILDKELSKEKVKAAAALKSLQEKLEEKLKVELEQKEMEKELGLKRTQELAKAELDAAIASEKASQIEKMAEANLDINALCMAFYARSEEARQSHSVHKLALGALALEEALSKGLPIQKEVDALQIYLQGLDKDSLLDLVLSSLPQETRTYGTDTLLQLHNKFDSLKGSLRHFALIPPGGGGILTHSLAHVASILKVQEADQSGEGIESLINNVEDLLTKGKILEAANTLEDGLKGSQAEQVVSDWVKKARNRATTEQALTLIQSYATSISLT